MRISEMLEKIAQENLVSFHMPGHKGRIDDVRVKMDVTEFEGTDNLHDPQGPIKETLEEISRVFQSKASFISVNGTTGSVHISIAAAFEPGDEILIQRNSHISIYHGAFLMKLKLHYLYEGEDLLKKIKTLGIKRIKGVILTSPSFYGEIISPDIYKELRDMGLTVIVDEAHGPHLSLIGEGLSACPHADIVLHSFHKTLPVITGAAVYHVFSDQVSLDALKRWSNVFQTTSPSYLMMKSIDDGLSFYEEQGKGRMKTLLEWIQAFAFDLRALKDYYIKRPEGTYDPTRLLLCHRGNVDYYDIERQLRSLGIQVEFASERGILLITTMMNEKEDFQKLLEALKNVKPVERTYPEFSLIQPMKVTEIQDSFLKETQKVNLLEAKNRISGDYVITYPPGWPVIVPGERIQQGHIDFFKTFKGQLLGAEKGKIRVLGETYD